MHKSFLTPFLLCWFLGATAFAQAPMITNIRVEGNTVYLDWDAPTNRFIVEFASSLTDTSTPSQCRASSTGTTVNTVAVPLGDETNGFFWLQCGLEVVEFSDSTLASCIRDAISAKHEPTNEIYDLDTRSITNLNTCSGKDIHSLSGLEACEGLRDLNLEFTSVSNIEVLGSLSNLEWLVLHSLALDGIDPLSNCTALTHLYLDATGTSNIWALRTLTNLVCLIANNNPISSIDALSNAVALEVLSLSAASVLNVWPLARLGHLSHLELSSNNLEDLAALVTNAAAGGLGTGDYVNVYGNPLSDLAKTNQIPTLRNVYGVTVNTN